MNGNGYRAKSGGPTLAAATRAFFEDPSSSESDSSSSDSSSSSRNRHYRRNSPDSLRERKQTPSPERKRFVPSPQKEGLIADTSDWHGAENRTGAVAFWKQKAGKSSVVPEGSKQWDDAAASSKYRIALFRKKMLGTRTVREVCREHVVEKGRRLHVMIASAVLFALCASIVGIGTHQVVHRDDVGKSIGIGLGLGWLISGILGLLVSLACFYGAERVARDVTSETKSGDVKDAAFDLDIDTDPEKFDGLETIGQRILQAVFYFMMVLTMTFITLIARTSIEGLEIAHTEAAAIIALASVAIATMLFLAYHIVLIVTIYEMLQSLAEVMGFLVASAAAFMIPFAAYLLIRVIEVEQKVDTIPLWIPLFLFRCLVWIYFVACFSFYAAWKENRRMLLQAALLLGLTVIPVVVVLTVHLSIVGGDLTSPILSNCENIVNTMDSSFFSDVVGCQKYVGKSQVYDPVTDGYQFTTSYGESATTCPDIDGGAQESGRRQLGLYAGQDNITFPLGKASGSFVWEVNPVERSDGKLVDYFGCLNPDCCTSLAGIVGSFDTHLVIASYCLSAMLGTLIYSLLFIRRHTPASAFNVFSHPNSKVLQRGLFANTLLSLCLAAAVIISKRAILLYSYDLRVNFNMSLDSLCESGYNVSSVSLESTNWFGAEFSVSVSSEKCNASVAACLPSDPAACCTNGMQDYDEAGVDCGCSCNVPCLVGSACSQDCDCGPSLCCMAAGGKQTCAPCPPSCSNGVKDGDETDVDCGGACRVPTDCKMVNIPVVECARSAVPRIASTPFARRSRVCDPCEGMPDHARFKKILVCDETSVKRCAHGSRCAVNEDCLKGHACYMSTCYSCSNGIKDGSETGVDCGGGCAARCSDGSECAHDGDCTSDWCSNGRCQALHVQEARPNNVSFCTHDASHLRTDFDGQTSGFETDTDCGGGVAKRCELGQKCNYDGDCLPLLECAAGMCAARSMDFILANNAPHCFNGKLDIAEKGVDCGGPCLVTCPEGSWVGIGNGAECTSGYEVAGVCSSCTNGIIDGWETSVDCGGSACNPCPAGASCAQDADCSSLVCYGGICSKCFDGTDNSLQHASSLCHDGAMNGNETDVDCGGPDCAPCTGCSACYEDADCTSGVCSARSPLEGSLACTCAPRKHIRRENRTAVHVEAHYDQCATIPASSFRLVEDSEAECGSRSKCTVAARLSVQGARVLSFDDNSGNVVSESNGVYSISGTVDEINDALRFVQVCPPKDCAGTQEAAYNIHVSYEAQTENCHVISSPYVVSVVHVPVSVYGSVVVKQCCSETYEPISSASVEVSVHGSECSARYSAEVVDGIYAFDALACGEMASLEVAVQSAYGSVLVVKNFGAQPTISAESPMFAAAQESSASLSTSTNAIVSRYFVSQIKLLPLQDICAASPLCTDPPSLHPSSLPTSTPTRRVTSTPSASPTDGPTVNPTSRPSSLQPTARPTHNPTESPSASPSMQPSKAPSAAPSSSPTFAPTFAPSKRPTGVETEAPTPAPTRKPSSSPSASPTVEPTSEPTEEPTSEPTESPSMLPTSNPTSSPTSSPTFNPTELPTASPSVSPSVSPTIAPTAARMMMRFEIRASRCGGPETTPQILPANDLTVVVYKGIVEDGTGLTGEELCKGTAARALLTNDVSGASFQCQIPAANEPVTVFMSGKGTLATRAVLWCFDDALGCACLDGEAHCRHYAASSGMHLTTLFTTLALSQNSFRACLRWNGADAALPAPKDLDLLVAFPVSNDADESSCIVSNMRRSCGNASFETENDIGGDHGPEAIVIQQVHKTVYTFFVRNYGEDYNTETSGAVLRLDGLGFDEEFPLASPEWVANGTHIAVPGTKVPKDIFQVQPPSSESAIAFRGESRYARILCVDATRYPDVRVNWVPMFSDHQVSAMTSCSRSSFCEYGMYLADSDSSFPASIDNSNTTAFFDEQFASEMGSALTRILWKQSDVKSAGPLTQFVVSESLEEHPPPTKFTLPSKVDMSLDADNVKLFVNVVTLTPPGGGLFPSPTFSSPWGGDFLAAVRRNTTEAVHSGDLPQCANMLIFPDSRTALTPGFAGQRVEAVRVPYDPGLYSICMFRLVNAPEGCSAQPWCSAGAKYELNHCIDIELVCPGGATGAGCAKCDTSLDSDMDGEPDCTDECPFDPTRVKKIREGETPLESCGCGVPDDSFFTQIDSDSLLPACKSCNDESLCDNQGSYLGCVSVTESGRSCQRWSRQYPHDHGTLTMVKNYKVCGATPPPSMPYGAPKGTPCAFPFTYNGRVYDEGECVTSGPLLAGRGWCNTTLQLLPGAEALFGLSPFAGAAACDPEPCGEAASPPLGIGEHNFCRNPTGARDRPWCYTNDAFLEWEYCNVSKCSVASDPVETFAPTSAVPTTEAPSTVMPTTSAPTQYTDSPTHSDAPTSSPSRPDTDFNLNVKGFGATNVGIDALHVDPDGYALQIVSPSIFTKGSITGVGLVHSPLRSIPTYYVGCAQVEGIQDEFVSENGMTPNACALECFSRHTSEYFAIREGTKCVCGDIGSLGSGPWLKTAVSETSSSGEKYECVSNGQGLEPEKGKKCLFPATFNGIEFNKCIGSGWGGQGVCYVDEARTIWAGCSCTSQSVCSQRCSGDSTAPCGSATDPTIHSVYRIVMPHSGWGSTLLYAASYSEGKVHAFEVQPSSPARSELFDLRLSLPAFDVEMGRSLSISVSYDALLKPTLVLGAVDAHRIVFLDARQVPLGTFVVDVDLEFQSNSGYMYAAADSAATPGARRVYVSLSSQNAVYVYKTDSDGASWNVDKSTCRSLGASTCGASGECTGANDRLCSPRGLFVDASSNVYVADSGNSRVQKYSPDGTYLQTFGGNGELTRPVDVAVSTSVKDKGYVYVIDMVGLKVFHPQGALVFAENDRFSMPFNALALLQPFDDPDYCATVHGESARHELRPAASGECVRKASLLL